MRLAVCLALFAFPCAADPVALSFFEQNGCVASAGDLTAAAASGVDVAAIDEYVMAQMAEGHVVEQGAYTVLSPEICTIRLPQIETEWRLDAPEIQAITTAVDRDPEFPGCLLGDLRGFFGQQYPDDPARAYDEFVRFVAAHIISGEVRFFSESPLRTPATWQVVTGDCANVPEIDAMRETQRYIADEPFAEVIATLQANDPCFEERSDSLRNAVLALQGIDVTTGQGPDGAAVNAWMDTEFLFIMLAADWFIGDSFTERGMTRPPLCAWP
ncbi:hypothetical protein [Gymnodinialimonas hymeniacidonis]|uniref:hypothetical protein n=1 Tax=Gymnodinialimonas hymeniacidonis TaxID=3126508 RepID=UPI0034C6261C